MVPKALRTADGADLNRDQTEDVDDRRAGVVGWASLAGAVVSALCRPQPCTVPAMIGAGPGVCTRHIDRDGYVVVGVPCLRHTAGQVASPSPASASKRQCRRRNRADAGATKKTRVRSHC